MVQPGFAALLALLIASVAVPLVILGVSALVHPRGGKELKFLTYESGEIPVGTAWIQYNVRYYLFALIFVVFDVESVFLYPWAVAYNELGLFAFVEAMIFVAILALGLVYAWRKGALEWA
jgi:NAD(P)H-quinone oxidoreductase subunit 3